MYGRGKAGLLLLLLGFDVASVRVWDVGIWGTSAIDMLRSMPYFCCSAAQNMYVVCISNSFLYLN